jgi:hypothetical protein
MSYNIWCPVHGYYIILGTYESHFTANLRHNAKVTAASAYSAVQRDAKLSGKPAMKQVQGQRQFGPGNKLKITEELIIVLFLPDQG